MVDVVVVTAVVGNRVFNVVVVGTTLVVLVGFVVVVVD